MNSSIECGQYRHESIQCVMRLEVDFDRLAILFVRIAKAKDQLGRRRISRGKGRGKDGGDTGTVLEGVECIELEYVPGYDLLCFILLLCLLCVIVVCCCFLIVCRRLSVEVADLPLLGVQLEPPILNAKQHGTRSHVEMHAGGWAPPHQTRTTTGKATEYSVPL